ncbi:MAG: gliding motility-associated C-terminal domain-containing protein, partial [Bacteroidales bacterium]|nr:gliding motility-associated C-terminal domain-containing protein [Bacteroidales bacterium]
APYTYSVDASAFTTSTSYTGKAAGSHSIQVRDANGCIFATSVNIIQSGNTLAAPIIGAITQPSCSVATGSVILTGLPTLNWTINPGAITGSGSATTISGLVAGKYNYTITNAEGCISPVSSDVLIISSLGSPTAPVVGSIAQPSCAVTTGSVELTGLPESEWTINPGGISGAGSTTTISDLVAGTYNFEVTNTFGCISPASADVVILPSPRPTADFNYSLPCLGLPTYFFDHSESYAFPLNYWEWVVKDSIQTLGNMTGLNPTFTFLQQGSYSVIHTVSNSDGCFDSKTYKITVFPSPLSVFSVLDNYENKQGQILLENESLGADEYLWDFGNNETSTAVSPVITYNEDGIFLIQLFSRNKFGCVDSSSIIYKILFKGLWVPNALAAGTLSSANIWKPVGVNLSSYKAEIFDRWGKQLWSSDKLNNGTPAESWDGTYKGILCKEGTYTWKISATFKDGSIWPNANVDFRQNIQSRGSGTITLIR